MPAGKTYIKIANQTLASTSTSVTFSNLPQGYTDLVLVFNTRDSRATVQDGLGIRFNDDSGTNYFETNLITEPNGTYYDNFNRSFILIKITKIIPFNKLCFVQITLSNSIV